MVENSDIRRKVEKAQSGVAMVDMMEHGGGGDATKMDSSIIHFSVNVASCRSFGPTLDNWVITQINHPKIKTILHKRKKF